MYEFNKFIYFGISLLNETERCKVLILGFWLCDLLTTLVMGFCIQHSLVWLGVPFYEMRELSGASGSASLQYRLQRDTSLKSLHIAGSKIYQREYAISCIFDTV